MIKNKQITDQTYQLILEHQGFIRKIAYSFSRRGVEIEDLIQEGNLAILYASSKFDASLGFKFLTYAEWWIKAYMQRAVENQGMIIRKPSYVLEKARKIKKAQKYLTQKNDRVPIIEEIASHLDYSEEEISLIVNNVFNTEKIDSLDRNIFEQPESETLSDTINGNFVNAQNSIETCETFELLNDSLEELFFELGRLNISDEHRDIFLVYYEILEFSKTTLASIGKSVGVSRARIGQIIQNVWKALEKNAPYINRDFMIRCMSSIQDINTLFDVAPTVFVERVLATVKSGTFAREREKEILTQTLLENNTQVRQNKNNGLSVKERKAILLSSKKNALEVLSKKIDLSIDFIVTFYGFDKETVYSETQKSPVIHVRHVIMYLLKSRYRLSFPKIAKKMNKKDHTTVMHACFKIEQKLIDDEQFALELNHIAKGLSVIEDQSLNQ